MSAKPTGYFLIAVSLLGIGFSLFKNEDVLSGSWFNDQSTLITLIILPEYGEDKKGQDIADLAIY